MPAFRTLQEPTFTNSPWMLLNFLVNADPHLDNKKPVDLLKAGNLDAVIEAAHRMGGETWSSGRRVRAQAGVVAAALDGRMPPQPEVGGPGRKIS